MDSELEVQELRIAADPDDDATSFEVPDFLLDLPGVVRRRWVWMALAGASGVVATLIFVAMMTPHFTAIATLLITSQQIPQEFIKSTVQEESIANINAMIGNVLSQQNLTEIVERFHLFPNDRDSAKPMELIRRMRRAIVVAPAEGYSRDQRSLIYGVSFQTDAPDSAAAVANALADLFVQASFERRGAQAKRTTEFLKNEFERDERELNAQSQAVSEFKSAHRGELPSDLDTNLRKLEMFTGERQSLETRIAAKESQIVVLSTAKSDKPTQNEALLDELRRQLAIQTAIHTDEHPNVIALRDRVQRMEKMLQAERSDPAGPGAATQAAIGADRRELEVLRGQLAGLGSSALDVNRRVDRTPAVAEQLDELERKEKVLRERYLESMRKVQEAEAAENLEKAQQGAQVSVLDRAQPPTSPDKSRSGRFALGTLFSLALAIGVAVLLEMVDPVVLNAVQLEKMSDRKVLGAVPLIG